MGKEIFSAKIIDWYKANQRNLPWRHTGDPYKIWLSEIMLQQTRVAQALPYYERFLKSFPTVFALAKASEQKVLLLWQGLGYYSRARNLHRCAKLIVNNYEGIFPTAYEHLIKLPGIGGYTAAAIASIAALEPVAVLDGNVFRVLARIFGIERDIVAKEGRNHFLLLANKLLDKDRPDLYNQGIMEFGALNCVPKNPKCSDCIFSKSCEAKQNDLQDVLPVKSNKVKIKTRYFYYFILKNKNRVLMAERRRKDIWQGLNEFYLIETPGRRTPQMLVKRDLLLANGKIINESKVIKHQLTHQVLIVRFVTIDVSLTKKIEVAISRAKMKWFSRKQVEKIPKPILIERFLSEKNHEKEFW